MCQFLPIYGDTDSNFDLHSIPLALIIDDIIYIYFY